MSPMVLSSLAVLSLFATPSDCCLDPEEPFELNISVELAASKMPRPREQARLTARRTVFSYCIEAEFQFQPIAPDDMTLEFLLTLAGDGRIEATKVERVEVDSPRFRDCLDKGLRRFVTFAPPGRRTELRVIVRRTLKPKYRVEPTR
jgi:hypothetical protein